MDDDDYRAALASFLTSGGEIVQSSRQLSKKQAASLIESLQNASSDANSRPLEPTASSAQLRFIRFLWNRVSRVESGTEKWKALDSFIRHKYHVGRLRYLPRSRVPKVIKALKEMEKKQDRTSS
ncbi:MAG: phage protein GemA/Gp16 family protein [Chitinivibrionales bacterium]